MATTLRSRGMLTRQLAIVAALMARAISRRNMVAQGSRRDPSSAVASSPFTERHVAPLEAYYLGIYLGGDCRRGNQMTHVGCWMPTISRSVDNWREYMAIFLFAQALQRAPPPSRHVMQV
ncbi:hypothetical protein F5X68DRAFT_226531 [Plectosphaerella plurivora]|uniref:Uncharacterized protein n=1 Tax=Plectosphaerella plurivora TaxID=936078 RepID=A0A9P8VP95_9PEZI|nr:hypothetical protein F5X68DRAFT_226531 [Plectosphaerella plurivora]